MSSQPSAPQPMYAIRQYLEREFPGQVRHTGWEPQAQAHVFEVTHETAQHQVLVHQAVWQAEREIGARLHASELADYLREARRQARRFLVLADGGDVHIRSTAR